MGVALIGLGVGLAVHSFEKPVRAQVQQVEQASPEFILRYAVAEGNDGSRWRVFKFYHLKTQACWVGFFGRETFAPAPREVCQ